MKKMAISYLRSNPMPLSSFFISFLIFTLILSPSSAINNLSAYDVLRSYDFPMGLLPEGITGYELDPETGKFAAYMNKTCSFSIHGYKLKYSSTISGYISRDKLTSLKGVSVKILLFYVRIVKVTNTNNNLEFSVGITSASFPIDNFDECPQCGCGFDCNDLEVKSIGSSSDSVSSS